MDEILAMIEICVDAHAPHIFLYHAQWTPFREWYDEEVVLNGEHEWPRLNQYQFRKEIHKAIEVWEVLPNGYQKFRLLIVHDYREYTKREEEDNASQ